MLKSHLQFKSILALKENKTKIENSFGLFVPNNTNEFHKFRIQFTKLILNNEDKIVNNKESLSILSLVLKNSEIVISGKWYNDKIDFYDNFVSAKKESICEEIRENGLNLDQIKAIENILRN